MEKSTEQIERNVSASFAYVKKDMLMLNDAFSDIHDEIQHLSLNHAMLLEEIGKLRSEMAKATGKPLDKKKPVAAKKAAAKKPVAAKKAAVKKAPAKKKAAVKKPVAKKKAAVKKATTKKKGVKKVVKETVTYK